MSRTISTKILRRGFMLILAVLLLLMVSAKDTFAVSWINQVKSISFISVDPNNYVFYDGSDNVPIDEDDGSEDDYYFYEGDRIIATLNNGTTRTITYCEDEEGEFGWWEEENGDVLEEEEPSIVQVPKLLTIETPRTFQLTIEFAGKTTTQTAELKASPIKGIQFIPKGTEEEIANRFTILEGDELEFGFFEGDTLKVNLNGTLINYVGKKEYDSEFDEYYIEFYDSEGNTLPYEYGWVDWEPYDSTKWNEGTHFIYVTFGKERCSVPVKVVTAAYEFISFAPKKRTYTEAEMILLEDYYDEEEDPYYCVLEILQGDKLTLRKKETGETYTYTYDGENFVDADRNTRKEEWYEPLLYYEGADSCAREGTYTFTIEYANDISTISITVTKSGTEEKNAARELKNARDKAIEDIDEKYESMDLSKYREAELSQIEEEYEKAYDSASVAKTPQEARNAASNFINTVNKIKTDEQLKAEEAADRAAAEAARIDALEWNGTLSGAVPAAKSVKAKAAKKKVKVSWKKATKKNLKKFDKVEIQVCTDRGFNRANTKRVEVKKSKKSATVKGLTKGMTYYVRVRDVKGSGTGKLVSKWSGVKKVKIKK